MKPRRARSTIAAVASGVLLASAFAPASLGAVAWIALVPLAYAIDGEPPRRAFARGWLAGLVFFAATFAWIPGTIARTVAAGPVAAAAPLLAMAAVLALYVGAFAAGVRVVESRVARFRVLFAPAWWVTLEWARASLVLPCPWNLLGYSQVESSTALLQIVDVAGIYGVSACVVAANHVLYEALRRGEGGRARVVGVAVLAVAIQLYGVGRIAQTDAERPDRVLRVGLVQPAIDPHEKWDAARVRAVLDVQKDLARRAVAGGADLVVWPEASAPFVFDGDDFYATDPDRFAADRALRDELVAFVRSLGRPLVFGAPALARHDLGRGETWRSLNRSFLMEPDGRVTAHYDKMLLVPFGEYVPWPRMLFFVEKLVPGVGDFEPGREPVLFPLGQARFAVLVCYEAIFPDFVRRFVARGADLLVNQTNDAWFGATAAPAQHLALARVRAIENRTPLVRVANTGISAVVDPDGTLRSIIPLGERGVRVVEIGIGGRATSFYTRHGDVFALAAALAAVLLLVYAGWTTPEPRPVLAGAA